MGSWFSQEETKVEDSQAILQSADSAFLQLNWATFSTGLSSFSIILVLLLMLALCYKKNQRSNRRARRAELHDILHSLHRGGTASSAPTPSRGGYPQFPPAFAGAYTGLPMPMATMAPLVTYPGQQSTSTAVVPSGQMLQQPTTYGAQTAPRRSGFPGVNSGINRRERLRANSRLPAARQRPATQTSAIALPAPARLSPSGQQTDAPHRTSLREIKAITYVPNPEPIQRAPLERELPIDAREIPIDAIGKAKSMANILPGSFPADSITRLYRTRSIYQTV